MILLYVDDMLLALNKMKMLRIEKEELKKRFSMKNMDEGHYCLGIQVHRDRANKKMLLHETRYLADLLQK